MAAEPVIFSTHALHPEITAALQSLGRYVVARSPAAADILTGSPGSSIIVVRAPIDAAIVRAEKGLRALVRHGAGLDMIPVDVATECGVLVANVPGANATTVAEHAVWSAAALLRRYPMVAADLRSGGWEHGRRHADSGRELGGKTLGIVGMGNIGSALAAIARNGFGMNVVTHTRSPARVPAGIESTYLDALLAISDIVVLCCPLTDATRGLIGRDALALMKPGAVLVNVARGAIVNQRDLIDALKSGAIAGAALDVFEDQPLAPDSALFDLPNVVLTPHMAGITEESMRRMGQGVVDEVQRILGSGIPGNFVNPDALPAYRARFPAPDAPG